MENDEIMELNNAQIGSLGEYIFEQISIIKGENIFRKHSEQTDFIVKNERIDVKTFRKITTEFKKIYRYSGKRVDNIKYIVVCFYSDFVIISESENILSKLTLKEVNIIYEKWKKNYKKGKKQTLKSDKTEFIKVKMKITKLLLEYGVNARVIYRTNQEAFGNESPENLIPKIVKENNYTIFINYKNYDLSEKNIKEIIAFRDSEGVKFETISKHRLHISKIDIDKIDKKYRFKSIDDFIANFKKNCI